MSALRTIRSLASLVLACAMGLVAAEPASAETIALIGTGNVGAALGRRFAEQGHTVVYGSRNPAAADVARLVGALVRDEFQVVEAVEAAVEGGDFAEVAVVDEPEAADHREADRVGEEVFPLVPDHLAQLLVGNARVDAEVEDPRALRHQFAEGRQKQRRKLPVPALGAAEYPLRALLRQEVPTRDGSSP